MEKQTIISVIGTSTASAEQYEKAREVGRLLAAARCVVVCGGRGGVMEGVCRGVLEGGGISIGLLPAGAEEANCYVGIPLATGMGELRNVAVASAGEAVIAIGGAFGTLSEIGFALKFGKSVIALDTWDVLEPGEESPLLRVSTPEEAVCLALSRAGRADGNGR